MAAIAVVLDHTAAGALYDPKDPFNEAVAAFYVQASGGLGDLCAPVLSLTAGDTERPGLLGYIKGLRFIRIEAFDTDAAVTATELLHRLHRPRPPREHASTRSPPDPVLQQPHRRMPRRNRPHLDDITATTSVAARQASA
ncbi:hypothetical protein ACICHK_43035 (plasmid) [Streptomyces sp. AHU1]|uniref:hypothetical protein n=1 Tax=Streptomyces sp. AHU1 TaxID=3377215 RepID=UPI003877BD95